MDAVVDCWIVGLVMSEAVTVLLPAVFRVTLKVLVPEARGVPPGGTALASLVVMPTVSVTVLTTFHLSSTALTVTLKAVPAVCAAGVPVLPLAVPGAALSPGASSCNLVKAPTLTLMAGLVLAVLVPSPGSLAVTVRLPAVLSVTLKLCVPETNAAFEGRTALVSEDVMLTVSVTLVTAFQLASTALTETANAVPAV